MSGALADIRALRIEFEPEERENVTYSICWIRTLPSKAGILVGFTARTPSKPCRASSIDFFETR